MSSFCGKQVKISNIITDYENARSLSGFYVKNHEGAQPSVENITRIGPTRCISVTDLLIFYQSFACVQHGKSRVRIPAIPGILDSLLPFIYWTLVVKVSTINSSRRDKDDCKAGEDLAVTVIKQQHCL